MLTTERLHIRSYSADDLPALAAILTDATTMRFWPRPFTLAEADAWLQRQMQSSGSSIYGRRALILRETGALIGDAGVMRSSIAGAERNDLGYIIHHPFWGQGLAPEAARALRDHYLDSQGVEQLVANMAWDNRPSQRVAEKIGMRKQLEFNNPRNRDLLTYVYAIAAGDPRL